MRIDEIDCSSASVLFDVIDVNLKGRANGLPSPIELGLGETDILEPELVGVEIEREIRDEARYSPTGGLKTRVDKGLFELSHELNAKADLIECPDPERARDREEAVRPVEPGAYRIQSQSADFFKNQSIQVKRDCGACDRANTAAGDPGDGVDADAVTDFNDGANAVTEKGPGVIDPETSALRATGLSVGLGMKHSGLKNQRSGGGILRGRLAVRPD